MATRVKSSSNPPRRRLCGTMCVHHGLLESFAGFRRAQSRLEHATESRMHRASLERTAVTVIPTVVHVLWSVAAENLSDVQIRSQLAVLNRDFRATNPDRAKAPTVWRGLVADSRLEFELATTDPLGKTTTGITRTQTTKRSFSSDDSMKRTRSGGIDPWPTDRYLNIWVCALAGGLLGYAQFPGGPKATDGVVILNTAFGTSGTARAPFNLGRTCTHEVGHWLNLRHIWGDTEDCSGSDFVADTPNAEGPNYGKPAFPKVSCRNGPNGDMFMNYMDYVDDAAMVLFTPQQVARMHAALDGARKSIGRPKP
jgi:Pregnancy-associated plasma protein-A